MNKRPIGSKQAEKMARAKFGDRAAVQRRGKEFSVGTIVNLLGCKMLMVKGQGSSWEKALIAAGIDVPQDEVVGLPKGKWVSVPASQNEVIECDFATSDADPLDTDAKEPLVNEAE